VHSSSLILRLQLVRVPSSNEAAALVLPVKPENGFNCFRAPLPTTGWPVLAIKLIAASSQTDRNAALFTTNRSQENPREPEHTSAWNELPLSSPLPVGNCPLERLPAYRL
jgi:hypothetical protein